MKRVEIFKNKINLQDLPPTLILAIFSHLTVPTIQTICCVSKKFKVFAYHDDVYLVKVKKLGIEKLLYGEIDLNDDILVLLRRIPDLKKAESREKIEAKIQIDIPESNQTELIIPPNLQDAVNNADPKRERNSISVRAMFKKFYTKLFKFYTDFQSKSHDSLVFTTHSDVVDIATILGTLIRFDGLQLLNRNCTQIRFGLMKAIESFSSNLMSRFESAYDSQNFKEMELACKACYFIDGAYDLINLVVSKNPAFYDTRFNPVTLASDLKNTKSKEMDVYLAQNFADFIQYLLDDCLLQCEIVGKVFPAKVDPISIIVLKVIEECISDYFAAIVSAAKIREGTRVYLHVTATSIYCIKQFIHYLTTNSFGVIIKSEAIYQKANALLEPFINTYMEREVSYLKEVCQIEIDKWDSGVIHSNLEAIK